MNVQDSCVIHGYPKRDTLIEENGHIGHGAVLHACTVRRGALVGIKAVVMDDAEVGEQAVVAACAFVPVGLQVAPRTMVAGIPARVKRTLGDGDVEWNAEATRAYHDLTDRCLATLRETQPLPRVEPGRAAPSGHQGRCLDRGPGSRHRRSLKSTGFTLTFS